MDLDDIFDQFDVTNQVTDSTLKRKIDPASSSSSSEKKAKGSEGISVNSNTAKKPTKPTKEYPFKLDTFQQDAVDKLKTKVS